jgi:uncharacterized small protein (DUF1192 family)
MTSEQRETLRRFWKAKRARLSVQIAKLDQRVAALDDEIASTAAGRPDRLGRR